MFEDKKIKLSSLFTTAPFIMTWQEAVEKVCQHKACRLDDATDTPHIGWAVGNNELNTEITVENSVIADTYLYLAMRTTVRKVSGNILKALLRKKVAEYKKEHCVEYISAKVRREIKEDIVQSLLPKTIPTVKSVWVVLERGIEGGCNIYSGAVTVREQSDLAVLIEKTFDLDTKGVCLTDHLRQHGVDEFTGDEEYLFLTRLLQNPAENEMVLPPVHLIDPAKEQAVVKLAATGVCACDGEEVKLALSKKKMLAKVKMCVTGLPLFDEKDAWYFTLNPYGSFTSLECPAGEEMEQSARFCEKMAAIKAILVWRDEKYNDFAKYIGV